MASPDGAESRNSLFPYFELNWVFHGFASTRYDAKTNVKARAKPAAAHILRARFIAARSPMPEASIPQPHNQSEAAEDGESELNSPSGSVHRRKYDAPMTSPTPPATTD